MPLLLNQQQHAFSCILNSFSQNLSFQVVSFVPRRILSLLKFFGVRGDRDLAFKYLITVSRGDSMWAPVAAVNVLSHHCHAEFIVGLGNPDVPLIHQLLTACQQKYPGSGFFLVFEGTVRLMQGLPHDAIQFYEDSIRKFEEWPEWQYACHWFIAWCYAIQCQWQEALEHTEILVDKCNWSKCVFTYQYAAILKMIEEETEDPAKKSSLRNEIDHHLRMAPTFKRTFVGKTVFVEKFVTKRCQIYWSEKERQNRSPSNSIQAHHDNNNSGSSSSDQQRSRLEDDAFMLPVLDLFLFWNLFYTFKSAPAIGTVFLKKVEHKLQAYPTDSPDQEKHFYLILMKGIILKSLGQQEAAIECLTSVLDHEQLLKRYGHLAPLACLELGTLFSQTQDYTLAQQYLNKAMSDYTHYLNETTVHIRAHAILETVKSEIASQHKKLSNTSLASLGSRLNALLSSQQSQQQQQPEQ